MCLLFLAHMKGTMAGDVHPIWMADRKQSPVCFSRGSSCPLPPFPPFLALSPPQDSLLTPLFLCLMDIHDLGNTPPWEWHNLVISMSLQVACLVFSPHDGWCVMTWRHHVTVSGHGHLKQETPYVLTGFGSLLREGSSKMFQNGKLPMENYLWRITYAKGASKIV